jgi:arsenite oxidase large subunit
MTSASTPSQATPATWVDELNNCLEDAQLADTSVVLIANPLKTQTNYLLNHLMAKLRGACPPRSKATA